MERTIRVHGAVKAKLFFMISRTLLIVILLIYLNEALSKATIVLLEVPFSLVGTLWYLYFLGCQMSTVVWVGVISLAGLDVETGTVMLLYLDLSCNRWHQERKDQFTPGYRGLSDERSG
jgi:copper/silver efflux system protein